MKKYSLIVLIAIIFQTGIFSATMVHNPDYEKTTIFSTDLDKKGWQAYIVGRVLSLGTREIAENELNQHVQEKSKVTIRLYSDSGLRKGQVLYIINDRNLIVAKVEVKFINKSSAFGYLLIGYGNFRRVNQDMFVALRIKQATDNYTYVYKSRGDYFYKIGDTAKAIQMYEKAVEVDKNNASAHMKLAEIYYNKKIYTYAKKEYDIAYENLWNVYDNQDKFDIIKGMALTRYLLAYESGLPKGNELRNKYISEGIVYCKMALEMYDNSADLNYYYGYFLYNNSNPNDSLAKDQMLKVIELDKNNINAHIILARLYYKYKNREKAIQYAEEALNIDPSNLWAKDTFKKVNISY